jgi:hypothetical protein
MTLAKGN